MFQIVFLLLSVTFATPQYPTNPDASMTPGQLCEHPDSYRYKERIPYCHRNVSKKTKNELVRSYDRELGYRIGKMNRREFKIDHYIPLCMGGSNDPSNLWPQHHTVYEITDPVEQIACEKMAENKLLQAQAIEYIRTAKSDFSKIPDILVELEAL